MRFESFDTTLVASEDLSQRKNCVGSSSSCSLLVSLVGKGIKGPLKTKLSRLLLYIKRLKRWCFWVLHYKDLGEFSFVDMKLGQARLLEIPSCFRPVWAVGISFVLLWGLLIPIFLMKFLFSKKLWLVVQV